MELIENPWFVLVLGMGTVFIGLFLLVIIIKIMGAIAAAAGKKSTTEPADAPAAPAAAAVSAADGVQYPHDVDRAAFDAAVAAAIAAYTGSEANGFRFTKITKL